ncbi:MAG: glycosyltransferase family 4 protein [Parvularculaceae bacterium]
MTFFCRNSMAAIKNVLRTAATRSISIISSRLFPRLLTKIEPFLKYRAFEDAIRGDVREWSPTTIHAHDLNTLPAAASLARDVSARIIYDSHELETHRQPPPPPLRRRFIARLERSLIKNAETVITVSDAIADHLAELYEIERPLVVRNAPAELRPSGAPARPGLRAASDLSERTPLLVYTGAVVFNRGIDVVVEALASLPDCHFAAVGPHHDPTVEKLRARAVELGVDGRFHLPPAVAPHEVVDFVASADIGVIPIIPVTLSYEYALPNKLFEMAFAGLPIVSSNLTEISKFISAYRLGETFPPGDVAAFVDRVNAILMRGEKSRPTTSDVDRMRQEHSWRAQLRILEQAYRNSGSSDRDG